MVDKSKRSGDAAFNKPAAALDARSDDSASSAGHAVDLDACFGSMSLAGSSPSLLPRPRRRPEPVQVPVPTTSADVRQQVETVRRPWPKPPSHAVGESSAAAEYASLLGHSNPSIFFGPSSPRVNALAGCFPSVSAFIAPPAHPLVQPPPPSMPSTSTNHYQQPTASASHQHGAPLAWNHNDVSLNPFASAPPAAMPPGLSPNNAISLNPFASALPAAMPSGLGPNNASINPYAIASQPCAAADSFLQHGNASIDPYHASAFPSEPQPYQVAADYHCQPWAGMLAVRRVPTLQEVRSRLLRSMMDLALLRSPQTAAHVVQLLHEGSRDVRWSVLAGVVRAVHSVMKSREANDAFLALLAVCEVQPDELRYIVDAVCGGKGVLMDILKHDHGVKAFKALIKAVAPHPQFSESLVVWLIRERMTEHCKCGELLKCCFDEIPYDTCSCMIRFAIWHLEEMLLSASGSMYLAECFVNARNNELNYLEQILLKYTSQIAMGQFSNYFLQRALECGRAGFKESIAERVAADVANLSVDKFGSFVVEACFLQSFSLMPMHHVLTAFLRLSSDQLAELVRGGYSNYVVHKLLAVARRHFPDQTMELARRIERLPMAVLRDMHAQRVIRVVRKLFPKRTRH